MIKLTPGLHVETDKLVVLAGCIFVVVAISGLATPARALDPHALNGLNYLAATENPDGGWGGTPASSTTSLHSTTAVVDTVRDLALEDTPGFSRGVSYVESQLPTFTDGIARKVVSLSGLDADIGAEVEALLERQNSDGGWGADAGYSSNVLDTALAVRALFAAGFPRGSLITAATVSPGDPNILSIDVPLGSTQLDVLIPSIAGAVEVRIGQGRVPSVEGPYFAVNGPALIRLTPNSFPQLQIGKNFIRIDAATSALFSLEAYIIAPGGDGQVPLRGLKYLLAAQNADGGWGFQSTDQDSRVFFTAEAAEAFVDVGDLSPVVSFLATRQNTDGGFGDAVSSSVFETALAIRIVSLAGMDLSGQSPSPSGFLAAAQLGNGSWNDDAYETALAIRALVPVPGCGDGTINRLAEQCDGTDLGGTSCASLGFNGGVLLCNSDCTLNSDGCSTCTGSCACGNGLVDSGEQCDDHNGGNGDGCGSTCQVEPGWSCVGQPSVCGQLCGNGSLEPREQCDDGNVATGDGCDSTCLVEPDWICTGQPSICSQACGDGLLQGAEQCDDANATDGDGCSTLCTIENCYTCAGEPSICAPTTGSPCNDGIFCNGIDTCNGGSCIHSGDPCSGGALCAATCNEAGDSCFNPLGTACDDGNPTTQDDQCDGAGICAGISILCGNSFVDPGEACDDGNNGNGDGCAANCVIEPCFSCNGQPSVCSAPPAGVPCLLPPFDSHYSLVDLGSVAGVPPLYGGLVIKRDSPNILLIGGQANGPGGQLFAVNVVRDSSGHITGFSGSASLFAEAAYNDGGVVYGPDGILFLARWPVNQLGQTLPGSSITDKIISLGPLNIVSSISGLNFVPSGFPGAGDLKLVSYPTGDWYTAAFAPDGTGTYDLLSASFETTIPGGPEGFVYVPAGSPEFTDFDALLVSEFQAGKIATYELDANGDPVPASRREVIVRLTGAEGATIDPVTGDFLFSTFGGGNRVIAVRGFATEEACGNGILSFGETCDDENTMAGDGCSPTCQVEVCYECNGQPSHCAPSNGTSCDDGLFCNGTDTCSAGVCARGGDPCIGGLACANVCNESIDSCFSIAGTSCDDGNAATENDRCDGSGVCSGIPNLCGNGTPDSGETCDDGNRVNGDGCDANCTVTACGNAMRTGSEQCDDGNLIDGDGCDANCMRSPCDSTVIIYQNNFENPSENPPADLGAHCPDISVTTVNVFYGPEFKQTNTVETIAINGPGDQYSDPSGAGGNYALGMLSDVQDDKVALTFDSLARPYLNVHMDVSPIDVNGCGGPFGVAQPIFRLTLYDTPSGVFDFDSPGTVLSTVDVAGSSQADPYIFNWKNLLGVLSTSGSANDTVTIVWDLLPGSGYAAFDNLKITATDTPASVTGATQLGVDFLTPDVVNWTQTVQGGPCVACHRQGAAVFGLSTAHHSGYAVDLGTNGLGFLSSFIATDQQPNGSWVHEGSFFPLAKTSYAFFGLAGYDKNVATTFSSNLVTAAEWALTRQAMDGHWDEDHQSRPTTYGQIPITARMMVGVAQAKQRVDSVTAAMYQTSLDTAAEFIRAHKDDPSDVSGVYYNYELAWALIGLKGSGAADSDADVAALVTRAYSRMSAIGYAWGGTTGAAPDPFNTGIMLYALCLAGERLPGNIPLDSAVQWLLCEQEPNGQWGGAGTADLHTTFAILGLGCFGDLGVDVEVVGPNSRVLASANPLRQTAEYDFDVRNTGLGADTYDLVVQGGLPGWAAVLDVTSITLQPAEHGGVHLTVDAPANLPEALPVEMTVVVRSRTSSSVSASARVTTYTDPPPPVTGDSTVTTITAGGGASIDPGQSVTLGAQVQNSVTSTQIVGPGMGVVTFYVAGLSLGADTDSDGDGTFSIDWSIPADWSLLGVQDLRAIYSGIDLPPGQADLLPSVGASTIKIGLCINVMCADDGEVCNGPEFCDVMTGGCVSGPPAGVGVACDDGNPCTDNTCDGMGMCGVPNTAPCDDADACTEGDVCSNGACSGTAMQCFDDGNDCNGPETCDAGACSSGPSLTDGSPCDDGLFCTGPDSCQSGVCQHAGDPCPGTACNMCQENSDSCFDPLGTPCGAGTMCNGGGACAPVITFAVLPSVTATDEVPLIVGRRAVVDGAACADFIDLRSGSTLIGDGVALRTSGDAAHCGRETSVEGHFATGGAPLDGLQRLHLGMPPPDTTGTNPLITACNTASLSAASDRARFLALPTTPGMQFDEIDNTTIISAISSVAGNDVVIDIRKFRLKAGATLTLAGRSTGSVIIRVAGNLHLARGASIVLQEDLGNGLKPDQVVWIVGGRVLARASAQIKGTLYAQSTVRLGSKVIVDGQLLSDTKIRIGQWAEIHGQPFRGWTTSNSR